MCGDIPVLILSCNMYLNKGKYTSFIERDVARFLIIRYITPNLNKLTKNTLDSYITKKQARITRSCYSGL